MKLTDWQSPIERTSRQCWKQKERNSGLKSHTVIFFRIRGNVSITYSSIRGNPHIVLLIITGFRDH